MPDNKETLAPAKAFSMDWLVRGILTKLGDIFDKLTGRNWKPSSSLATSELIVRLKKLLDDEARPAAGGSKFVPHNIQLKMQWDKFSTDEKDSIQKFENELLVAAIDHINDHRYHTRAPLTVRVKPDYFTEGVKLTASFDDAGADEREAEVNVTVPQIKVGDLVPPPAELPAPPEPEPIFYAAEFMANGRQKSVNLKFSPGQRLSVGRTKENDLAVEDPSVSKVHATLMVNREGVLLLADTGSTNGTFIDDERISYGRAFSVSEASRIRFGDAEVHFRLVPKAAEFAGEEYSGGAALENSSMAQTNASSGDNSRLSGEKVNSEAELRQKQTAPTDVYDRKSFSQEMERSDSKEATPKTVAENSPQTAPGINLNFTDADGERN